MPHWLSAKFCSKQPISAENILAARNQGLVCCLGTAFIMPHTTIYNMGSNCRNHSSVLWLSLSQGQVKMLQVSRSMEQADIKCHILSFARRTPAKMCSERAFWCTSIAKTLDVGEKLGHAISQTGPDGYSHLSCARRQYP